MPTPFLCNNCTKPTMNSSCICSDCELAYKQGNNEVFATVKGIEDRVEWLENGLKEIIDADVSTLYIKQKAQSILDGEPTTADEHNVVYMSDINKENVSWRRWKKEEEAIDETHHSNVYHGVDNIQNENVSPENTVRISDVNKEIAKEWKKEEEADEFFEYEENMSKKVTKKLKKLDELIEDFGKMLKGTK